MKATIHRQIFTTTVFDSGSLGMLTSVVHQFDREALYGVEIRRHGRPVASTFFRASDDAGEMQLDLDLASLHADQSRRADCDCDDERAAGVPVVSTKGYVLFFVSRGDGGYSVLASPHEGDEDEPFDSTTLGGGDLFALSLLEPTSYSMTNRLGEARGSIEVRFSPERLLRMRSDPQTCYIETYRKRFEPAEVEVTSTQGIVFQVKKPARIVIERRGLPTERRRPERRRFRRVKPAGKS